MFAKSKSLILGLCIFAIGSGVGFWSRDHVFFESHSDCVERAEFEIALKNLETSNSMLALYNAKKKCDQRHVQELDFDEEADLQKAIRISSSLKFGENGVHQLYIDNATVDFLVTNLEVEMTYNDAGYEGKTQARTGYIRVSPKVTDYEAELKTDLFGTSDLTDENFSFSIVRIWGVKSLN